MPIPRVDTPRAKRRHSTERVPSRNGNEGAAVRKYKNTSTNAVAETIDPDKPLTEKQRLFARYWASGDSILIASAKAGYADGGAFAYRLVHMPNVLVEYQAEKRRIEEENGMSRKRVIDGFLESIDMAKLMSEPSSMIAGWREVGRMCGYYEAVEVKHTVTHEGRVILDRLEKMSDADLVRAIEERANAMRELPAPGASPADGEGS